MTTSATKVLLGLVVLLPAVSAAAEVTVEVMPVRYAAVDGDNEKFSEHHWIKEGAVGGIRDFSASRVFSGGATLEAGGHALVDEGDLGSSISLTKQDLGFARFDYSKFRKYYDGTGGMYHYFSTLQANETDRNLALNIGKVGMETGLALEGWPELGFEYCRDFKYGAKSRLIWTAVKEGTTSRNIGPSWQEVDERTDRFAVKASREIAGFSVGAKQEWEFMRSELMREERNLSTTAAAADKKIRRQDQAPEATLMTTTLNAQRNFLNEKLFFSSAYRLAHMNNREFETIIESNAAGTATNFSNPKQIRDARADNDYNTHTWIGSFMASPWKWLTIGTKMKAELIRRESNSSYPADASPNSAGGSAPNGVIDQNVVSLNENKAVRWGEGLSLRFTGVPRTALYTELEMEQSRVRLYEDRKDLLGPNAGETFNRFTVDNVERETVTVGGQSSPWSFLTLTAHLRHRRNNNDYDDQRETDSTGTTARSAFVDGQKVITDELATRVAWKPRAWVQPSVRYQFRQDGFSTRAENEPIVKTGMLSHIITCDLTLQPCRDLLTTISFSRQMATVTTPARYGPAAGGYTPPFRADVNTWLASADYAVRNNLTLTGALQYSRADNFDDFSRDGLPLGASNAQLDATAGLRWAARKDASVSLEYGFYHYLANSNADTGDYDAHMILVEASKKF